MSAHMTTEHQTYRPGQKVKTSHGTIRIVREQEGNVVWLEGELEPWHLDRIVALTGPEPKPGIEQRQFEGPGIGVNPDGTPNIMTMEEYRRRLPLIAKAVKTDRPEDWEAAGIPMRIRPFNPDDNIGGL
jgi:hypothetical protein